MMPYWYIPTVHLGPFTIHVWGFFVGLGFMVSLAMARARARRASLDLNRITDLGIWILVGAFVGARMVYVMAYDWGSYQNHVEEIIKIWRGGLSSFGGFAGAVIAFFIYTRSSLRTKRLAYADVLAAAFPLGWAIGRIGCFLTHMHIGRLSSAPWAVAFPDGARLDMGLIESVFGFILFGVISILSRRSRPAGFYLGFVMLSYGAVRFILDFYRATDIPMADIRYASLTPAQWGCIILVVGGAYVWYRRKKHV